MRRLLQSRAVHRLHAFSTQLATDCKGMAAVEFAMIAPILFFLLVGSIEISHALTIDRRTTQAASSSADLSARAPPAGLSTAEVDGQLLIVNYLMRPYDVNPLTVKIMSVIARQVGNATQIQVDWSRDNKGGTPFARNSSYATLPVGLLTAGESVIVAEANYAYTPFIFHYFIATAFTMNETFYLKPRNSSCVNLLPISCVTGNVI